MKKLYLCTCNKTLNKTLDFAKIEKETSSLFDKVEVVDALCLEEGLKGLSDNVANDDVVVLGACSSQIIGVPVAKNLKNDRVAFVPIREHVAWVHADDKDSATNKAIVLLSDGVTWLNHSIEKTDVSEEVVNHVLVIGGGVAAFNAASNLVKLGVETILAKPVDWNKDEYLSQSASIADEASLSSTMKALEKSVKSAKSINCDIVGFEGQLGNFVVSLKKEDESEEQLNVGAIIIAVESSFKLPSNDFENSVALLNLPKQISETKNSMKVLVTIDPKHNLTRAEGSHLLRVTTRAVESGHTVFVVHQDIRTEDEDLYRNAREAGVMFIRGSLKSANQTDDGFTCVIENTLEGLERELAVNLLAVQTITTPGKGLDTLAETLGVELDPSGFIKTRYSKMKPVQTSRKGIFIAGNSKMPMGLSEILASGGNAALEAFKVVREPVKRRGWVPVIDEEQCDVCKACLDSCPNDAIRLVDEKIQHIPIHCEFCGICVAACPTRAIEFQSHGKDSWFARLENIGATHKKLMGDTPFTLVYACSECANASIDQAGFTGKSYPVNTYVLQFPCAGMISPIEILKGLVEGAENIIIAHCPPEGCHHQSGDHLSELVVELTRDMLKEIGQDPERVRATFMIAALPDMMQKEVARRG